MTTADGIAAFFARPAWEVAPELLGSIVSLGPVSVELTEVEAYAGPRDPASHAFRGPTPRAAVMFGPPGRVYVYLSHGMHHCMNLVCEPAGTASAVLLRAGRVVAGIDEARVRRAGAPDVALARGPGNLARALGVTRELSGTTVWGDGLSWRAATAPQTSSTGPRVGVRAAADVSWRFWVPGDPTVSPYRRHAKADPAPAPEGAS